MASGPLTLLFTVFGHDVGGPAKVGPTDERVAPGRTILQLGDTPCRSESALSLKFGLQAFALGAAGVPRFPQTDRSSTATHQLNRGERELGFNAEYVALCERLGLEPRAIAVASPNQNGDVEAAQGVLKRRLKIN